MSDTRTGAEIFTLRDSCCEHLDILVGNRIAARYMYAYDNSTPERLHETYKPYLHVFDSEGKVPITKGPGGKFTHHRGIFIGWNRMRFGGNGYDRWHMKGGEIIHQEFASQQADAEHAAFTSLTHWNDESGNPMIQEERTMAVCAAPAPFRLIIDFEATLTAPVGDVVLDGDPEHAGVQYRPADEIASEETIYVFPQADADPRVDLDYPWVGETYILNSKQHSVVEMNHPDNPKGTKYSAYRDYGRFGAFFTAEIPSGQSLTMKYRFLIADGEMPSAGIIQGHWDAFAGATVPTAVPQVTVTEAVPKAKRQG